MPWELVIFSAGLVVYGNLGTVASWQLYPWSLASAVGHPLLIVGALAWARRRAGFSWADLGLGRRGWGRGALFGLGFGIAMAAGAGALILLARAVGWSSTTTFPRPSDLAGFVPLALQLIIGMALCEEVWFRGVLLAGWMRALGRNRGILVAAGWFTLWHLTIWSWTLTQVTTSPPLPLVLTFPFGLLVFVVAGSIFAWLRVASGHLAAPIAAHGVADLILVAFVFFGWL